MRAGVAELCSWAKEAGWIWSPQHTKQAVPRRLLFPQDIHGEVADAGAGDDCRGR